MATAPTGAETRLESTMLTAAASCAFAIASFGLMICPGRFCSMSRILSSTDDDDRLASTSGFVEGELDFEATRLAAALDDALSRSK